MAAWSMPTLKTISAPLKMMLRLKTTSFPLKMMLIGVKRARISIVMPRMVYADALTRLYPLTSLFGGGATEVYSVATTESDLCIENLLFFIGQIVSMVGQGNAVRTHGSLA